MPAMSTPIGYDLATNRIWYEPTWERLNMIEDKVRLRRERAIAAFRATGFPYAMAGGFAVANWIARVDESLIRATRDVDILIRRDDLNALIPAMATHGYFYEVAYGVDVFLEGQDGKPSEGIHLLFAGEKVKPTDVLPLPTIEDSEDTVQYRVVSLEGLVRMKLMANRNKDRTHIDDLIGAKLIDDTWPARFPSPLDDRLRDLLANMKSELRR